MFNWFKKKSKHDCAKDASFTAVDPTVYKCTKCFKKYKTLQFQGAYVYINPILIKYLHTRGFKYDKS